MLLLSGLRQHELQPQADQRVRWPYSGNVSQLGILDSFNDAKSTDIDLLYKFEHKELRRSDGNIAGSTESWLQADGVVRAWKTTCAPTPANCWKVLARFCSTTPTRKYEGRIMRKVMLNLGLALNHLTLNDWDSARIEIKKMHERQALIAEYQSQKLESQGRG